MLIFVLIIFTPLHNFLSAQDTTSLKIVEDFNDLSRWEAIYFSAKKQRTDYEIVSDSNGHYLKIQSNKSASGILYNTKFNPYEKPVLSWRWRVESIIENADGREKAGDDYAVRIFILFAYNPDDLSFWTKLKNSTFNLAYGYEPPESGLILVWANKEQQSESYKSPYSDDLMIWNVRQGKKELKEWKKEQIDIIGTYQRAFGKLPPKQASIVIMGDSDNTKQNSIAFIDYIKLTPYE